MGKPEQKMNLKLWNWKSLGKDDSRDYDDFEWFLSRFEILF